MESVLFISPYRPGDRAFGSDTRTRSVLRWFKEAGIPVHFAYATRKFFDRPPSRELRQCIASYHGLHVAGCHSSPVHPMGWQRLTRPRSSGLQQYWSHRRRSGQPLQACIGELLDATQATLLWINHTMLAPIVENLPRRAEVTRILDTHDVLHLRDASLRTAGLCSEQQISRDRERELLSRFDLVLAIQDCEREILRGILPQQNIITLGHAVEVRPQPTTAADICFVGSQYIVNELELLNFLRDCWPQIRNRCERTRLQVIGGVSNCPSVRAAAQHDPRIVRRGIIEHAADMYAGPAVVICPMWCGSGLTIKLVEALAHGKATVASPLAAEGLVDGAGDAFLTAQRPSDFVDLVVALLHDHEHRRQLENSATKYAATKFGAKNVWREFSKFLEHRSSARLPARAA